MKYPRAKILFLALLVMAIAGLIVFIALYVRLHSSKLLSFSLAPLPVTSILPVRIKIPSIGVDAVIEPLAQTSDGFMDTPKFPYDAGWYKLGPRPGEKGSAVIDGHVNWIKNARAVFADLQKLKPGDEVSVVGDTGAIVLFKVRYSRTYQYNADATDIFTSTDGNSHLNLITCSGAWDKAVDGYSQRLVVFTEKE